MPMATGVTKNPYFSRLTANASPAAQPKAPNSPTSRLLQVSQGTGVAPVNVNREQGSVPSHVLLAGDNGSVESVPSIAVRTPTGLAYAPGTGVGRG